MDKDRNQSVFSQDQLGPSARWTTFTLTILSNKKIKRKEQIQISGVSVDKFSKIKQKMKTNETNELDMIKKPSKDLSLVPCMQGGNLCDN